MINRKQKQATHRLPAFRIVRTMLLSHLLPLDGVGPAEMVTNNNKEIQVIPDAIQDGTMYEIKDTKAVYNTKQIQGERNAAKELNLDYKIITGEGTHVSSKIPKDEIIKRNDIGP